MAQRYLNKKTVGPDGVTYDSITEAKRGYELSIMQRAGQIAGLERQVPFACVVNGRLVCTYIADFRYTVASTGEVVVEDVKSPRTRALHDYRIKVKLVEALHGVNVVEYVNGTSRRSVRIAKSAKPE